MNPKHLQTFGTHGLVLAALLLVFYPVIFLDQTLFYRDISMQDWPLIDFVVRSIQQKEVPWWNPYIFGGFPQMASIQPPLFYPFFWIYAALPFAPAMGLFLLLHYALAARGVYQLGRYWHLGSVSALLAAVVFSLNAYLFELNSLQFMLTAVAWIPWIFMGVEKYLDFPSRRPFWILVGLLALQVSTGRLDFVYFSALIAGIQCCWRLFPGVTTPSTQPLSHRFALPLLLVSAFGLAFCLLAIQVLPSLQFIGTTQRSSGLGFNEATLYSVNPLQLVLLFFNNLLGDNYWHRGISPLASSDFGFLIYNLYLGIPAFVLGVYALGKKSPRVVLLLLLVLFFSILALGKYTPVYGLFYHYFPGFKALRFPIKFLVFAFFFGSLLVGIGLERLLADDQEPRTLFFGVLGCCLVTGGLLGVVYGYHQALCHWFQGFLTPWGIEVKQLDYMKTSLRDGALVTAIFAAGLWAIRQHKIPLNTFGLGLILLVALDLTYHNRINLWTVNPSLFTTKPPVVAEIEQRVGDKRLYRLIKPIETVVPMRDRSKRLSDLYNNLATLNSNTALHYQLGDAYGYYPGEPSSVYALYMLLNDQGSSVVDQAAKSRILRLMAVRYYLWHTGNSTLKPPDERYFKKLKSDDAILELWEVRDFKSKIWFANEMVITHSWAESLQALLNPQSISLQTDAVIFSHVHSTALPKPEPAAPRPAELQLVSETNNTLHLNIATERAGYVVVANTFDHGWQATLDGQATTIYPTDFSQQAVFVKAGKHTLHLRYRPAHFGLSLWLCSLAWLAWLVLGWFSAWRPVPLNQSI